MTVPILWVGKLIFRGITSSSTIQLASSMMRQVHFLYIQISISNAIHFRLSIQNAEVSIDITLDDESNKRIP